MGEDSLRRFNVKDHFHLLEIELQKDYGLSPIASRALVNRMHGFVDELCAPHPDFRYPGQIFYPAVARREPAGKPLHLCRLQSVKLTVLSEEDKNILINSGPVVLRRYRVSRLAQEAYQQDGLLSQEDLRLLLSVDISTIRSLAQQCRLDGMVVPTRGYIDDIGSGISHKMQAINYYFKGFGPEKIASLIGHSMSSVERYLEDFARVTELVKRGFEHKQIQRITNLSSSLTRQYLSLFELHNRQHNELYLQDLRRRFGSLEQ